MASIEKLVIDVLMKLEKLFINFFCAVLYGMKKNSLFYIEQSKASVKVDTFLKMYVLMLYYVYKNYLSHRKHSLKPF